MNLVHNERIKLTASWANSLATTIITAGAVAPVAALLYGLSAPLPPLQYVVPLSIACLGLGMALHLYGRVILGSLRE